VALADRSLVDLTTGFVAYLGGDPRRGTTRAYADDLRQFVALAGNRGVCRLEDVTRESLYRYVADLQAHGYHPNTIHRRLAAVQSFYRYLSVEHGWGLNPTIRLRRERRPDPVPRAYDWPTAERILAEVPNASSLDTRNRCLLALWMYTGLRIGETLALDWRDVSFSARSVHVRHAKGGRERVVHFGETLASHFTAWREKTWRTSDDDPVFIGHRGSRMDGKAVYAAIAKYGLKERYGLSPHRLRHTHTTELLRRGVQRSDGSRMPVSLRTLQARLGHRDLRSTSIYLRVFDEDEREAGDALG
jgi:site-specific recombinase XerD